jgi:aminopeptidase N
LKDADQALEKFHARDREDHLVLDKWFAMQATIPSQGALEKVKALTSHPAFSFKNPNRVYSLIRSFAAFNPVGFNRPDGAGYRFIAGVVTELDRQNPSVAARIATAFRSWRMYEPKRRAAAETVLRDMQKVEPLSRDLGDILARTLEAS